jgi:hypothetical protein
MIGIMKNIIYGLLILILTACTGSPPVKGPDYHGDNNLDFGAYSVMIDKRFCLRTSAEIDTGKELVHQWNYNINIDHGVRVYLYEILNSTFFSPIDWSKRYNNVLYYRKPQFAQGNDIYVYRMIRVEYLYRYVISTFQYVGNQKWLVIEYFNDRPQGYSESDAKNMLSLADQMVYIRKDKLPKSIERIDRTMEQVYSIFGG